MIYKIKKGQHRAEGSKYKIDFSTRGFIAKVKFDDSIRYESPTPHWNKLLGTTTNGILVHRNSMRVGFRYSKKDDKVELGGYTYKKGNRQTEVQVDPRTGNYFNCFLNKVNINEEFLVACIHKDYKYHFYFFIKNGKGGFSLHPINGYLRLPAKKAKSCMKLLANPYFGGHPTAPHDITFEMDIKRVDEIKSNYRSWDSIITS